jgi:MFS family permease
VPFAALRGAGLSHAASYSEFGREAAVAWSAGRVVRDRNAGLYLAGVVVSGFGTSAMALASGVWVKSLTDSDSLAALTGVCLWAPTLFGPLIGVAADRADRRRLIVRANLAMGVLLLALLSVRSADQVWVVFAVMTVYGTASVLLDAAEAGLVAATVPADLRGEFNGLRMSANEGMKLLAPLVGAGLFLRFGGHGVALLDAATFALAAGVFALVRAPGEPRARGLDTPGLKAQARTAPDLKAPDLKAPGLAEPGVTPPGPAAPASWLRETADGVRALWRHPVLRRLVLTGALTMAAAGFNGAAIYAVVDEGLGRSPAFVGVLYAVQGVGSVAAGVLAGALMRRVPEHLFAAGGTAVFVCGVLVRTVPSTELALAGSALIGAGLPCALIAAMTAVQRESADGVVGRVAATAGTLVYAPNAVTGAAGAALIDVRDFRVVLVTAAVLGVAAMSVAVSRVAPVISEESAPR